MVVKRIQRFVQFVAEARPGKTVCRHEVVEVVEGVEQVDTHQPKRQALGEGLEKVLQVARAGLQFKPASGSV